MDRLRKDNRTRDKTQDGYGWHEDSLSNTNVQTHLSVMATCSNMADPVLLFQLPEIDVRLEKYEQINQLWCFFYIQSTIKHTEHEVHNWLWTLGH